MEPRIVLVGAGSSEFGFNSVLDASNIEALRGANLVLHDIDPQRLERMGPSRRGSQRRRDQVWT